MNIALIYIIGLAIYSAAVVASYSEKIRMSNWFIPANMAAGLMTAYLWGSVVRQTNDNNQIYVRALWWDSMIVLTFALMPLTFGIKMNTVSAIGVLLIIIGIIITKIGG